MAVFTLSTKDSKPEDTQIILDIKEHCRRNCLNFSAIVVEQLKKYHEEISNDRRTKV